MKTSKNSVTKLAESLLGKQAAKNIQKKVAEQRIASILAAMRCEADLSQKEFAEKIGETQSNISKTEKMPNDNLKIGTLRKYSAELGYNLRITFLPNESLARKIKWHICHLLQYLDELATLPKNDADIAAGIHDFLGKESMPLFKKLFEAINHLEKISPNKKKHWGITQVPCKAEEQKKQKTANRTEVTFGEIKNTNKQANCCLS